MNFRRAFKLFVIVLIVGLLALILRPVPIVSESECLVEKGMVVRIYETGEKDISIALKGIQRTFYINRGFERRINRKDLSKLMGREAVIKYPKYWTPLDPRDRHKHISKLEYDGVVVFDETI